MLKKKVFSGVTFIIALSMVFVAINQINDANRASAYIVKEPSTASSENPLKPIIYNGEEMFVAKSTFYDYHSDSEVGTTSIPNEITEAQNYSKNTFELFNMKLFNLMKYGDAAQCPATYPMYQGRHVASGLMTNIYKPGDEAANTATNYWVAANSPQGIASATQGLVDSKLTVNTNGESILTQTNRANGKSAPVPYFNKSFLTSNKFDNSELSLATVRDNMSFPFRKVVDHNVTYYQFQSNKDTIKINSNNEVEYLGYNNSSVQVKDTHGDAGFFPYNTPEDSASNKLNYGHGLKIEIPFIMTNDGKLNGKDIIFEFSGDDDVWVFIDGQLALDIGGSHGEITGTLNFANQTSVISKVKEPRYAFASHSATALSHSQVYSNYKSFFSSDLKSVLNDTNKIHTLTFFYMERGMDVANLKLNFNLPEPTKLTVSNELKLNNINSSLKTETAKVAANDKFVYDIVDKSINRKADMIINNKESVLFANEFNLNDTMIVQESRLQDESRSLSHYYNTNWLLKDSENEISKKDNSLVVSDNRTSEENTFKFANKNDSNTPILSANFVNSPKTGTFSIETNVTNEYKAKYSNYKTHIFTYKVSHKNIFNGDSAETIYNGEYTITHADGTTATRYTTNGLIKIKVTDIASIKGIPVDTVIIAQAQLLKTAKLSNVSRTDNFTLNEEKTTATGKIISTANELKYTITTSLETAAPSDEIINTPKEDNSSEKELHNISKLEATVLTSDDNNTNTQPDALDDTPSTMDSNLVQQWIAILVISLFSCIVSAITVAKKQR